MKFISMVELMALPETDEIPELLHAAALRVESGYLDSASWRLADASLLLRQRMTRRGYQDAGGFDSPTGRGAYLGGETAQPSAPTQKG